MKRVGWAYANDALVGVGLAVVVAGVWMIHRPTAIILVGLCLVAVGVALDLVPRKKTNTEHS